MEKKHTQTAVQLCVDKQLYSCMWKSSCAAVCGQAAVQLYVDKLLYSYMWPSSCAAVYNLYSLII